MKGDTDEEKLSGCDSSELSLPMGREVKILEEG